MRLDISTAITVLEGMEVGAFVEKEVPTKRKVALKLTSPIVKGATLAISPRPGPIIKDIDKLSLASPRQRSQTAKVLRPKNKT